MQPFGYIEPRTLDDTLRLARKHPDAHFLAGGTTIVDLMKSGAMRPSVLIDINRLDALNDVTLDDNATLHIGALAGMSDVASNGALRREAPGLSDAPSAYVADEGTVIKSLIAPFGGDPQLCRYVEPNRPTCRRCRRIFACGISQRRHRPRPAGWHFLGRTWRLVSTDRRTNSRCTGQHPLTHG
jgi:hypothetical protein